MRSVTVNGMRTAFACASAVVAMLLAGVLAAGARAEVLTSTGRVHAEGAGEVWVYGQGEVRFLMGDDGRLMVRHADVNRVTSSGTGTRLTDGTTSTFVGFRGAVTVKGDQVAAYFKGSAVSVDGQGDIRVVMAGAGKYVVNEQDEAEWSEFGSTVVMGNPDVLDSDQAWGQDGEYESGTVAAVREIQAFPSYREWAVAYPAAALVLMHARSYYDWACRYPVAVSALYGYRDWGAWVVGRPHLYTFIHCHRVYVQWSRGSVDFVVSFPSPYSFYWWWRRYPEAAWSISGGVTFVEWSFRFPDAAFVFRHRWDGWRERRDRDDRDRGGRQGDRLDRDVERVWRSQPFDLDRGRREIAESVKDARDSRDSRDSRDAKFRVDLNRDGTVDSAEKKAADAVQKMWQNQPNREDRKQDVDAERIRAWMDRNRDGVVTVDETKKAGDRYKELRKSQYDANPVAEKPSGRRGGNEANPSPQKPPAKASGNRFAVDLDADGTVSQAEKKAADAIKKMWKNQPDKGSRDADVDASRVRGWLDRDRDGTVEESEVQKAKSNANDVRREWKKAKD